MSASHRQTCEMPALLACPFCGKPASVFGTGYYTVPSGLDPLVSAADWIPNTTIGCDASRGGCGACVHAQDLTTATHKWNRRNR